MSSFRQSHWENLERILDAYKGRLWVTKVVLRIIVIDVVGEAAHESFDLAAVARELIFTDGRVGSAHNIEWASLTLLLLCKHHNICMIVVEVIVADNSLLPRHEEIRIVLHLKIIRDQRKVEIHEKARRCLIAIDDVQCTLELGHVDKSALLIATIEPRKFIDTISFNSFLLVER